MRLSLWLRRRPKANKSSPVTSRISPGQLSPPSPLPNFWKNSPASKRNKVQRAESGPIFNFYMGKNTPERKDYIMDKLVVPVEE